MAKLGLHLQEGFSDDEIVIKINGKERMRREKVSTRRVLGLAEHVEIDVDDGPLSIEVSMPAHGLEKRVELEASDKVYVGISRAGDDLRVITRKTPFGYG
jgi:hypothetical protein